MLASAVRPPFIEENHQGWNLRQFGVEAALDGRPLNTQRLVHFIPQLIEGSYTGKDGVKVTNPTLIIAQAVWSDLSKDPTMCSAIEKTRCVAYATFKNDEVVNLQVSERWYKYFASQPNILLTLLKPNLEFIPQLPTITPFSSEEEYLKFQATYLPRSTSDSCCVIL